MKPLVAIARTAAFLSALLFLGSAIVIFIEIVARYAGSPTSWAQDFAIFFMIAGAFLCQASIMLDDGHVRVDFFIAMLSETTRERLIRLTLALSLVFIAIVFWYTLQATLRSYRFGLMSTGLYRVPIWVVQSAMPIGFGLLFLATAARAFGLHRPAHRDEIDAAAEI